MNAETSPISCHRENDCLWVTITNYAHRNALTTRMLRAIVDAAEEAIPTGVKVLVVRGENQVFSSGIDLHEATTETSNTVSGYLTARAFRQALSDFGKLPLPKIVQLERYCLGAGVLLASYANIRIAARDTFFALPELRRGVPFSADGMARMIYHFGGTRALDLVLTGRRFTATEANEFGFLTRLVEPDTIAEAVEEYAAVLADYEAYPLMQTVLTAQAAMKAAMRSTSDEFGGELLALSRSSDTEPS